MECPWTSLIHYYQEKGSSLGSGHDHIQHIVSGSVTRVGPSRFCPSGTALLPLNTTNTRRLFRRMAFGSQDSHWLAQSSFYSIICNMNSLRAIHGLCRLALDCWWWWPFENQVVISEKPTELTVNDRSLTRIRFADGTGFDR